MPNYSSSLYPIDGGSGSVLSVAYAGGVATVVLASANSSLVNGVVIVAYNNSSGLVVYGSIASGGGTTTLTISSILAIATRGVYSQWWAAPLPSPWTNNLAWGDVGPTFQAYIMPVDSGPTISIYNNPCPQSAYTVAATVLPYPLGISPGPEIGIIAGLSSSDPTIGDYYLATAAAQVSDYPILSLFKVVGSSGARTTLYSYTASSGSSEALSLAVGSSTLVFNGHNVTDSSPLMGCYGGIYGNNNNTNALVWNSVQPNAWGIVGPYFTPYGAFINNNWTLTWVTLPTHTRAFFF